MSNETVLNALQAAECELQQFSRLVSDDDESFSTALEEVQDAIKAVERGIEARKHDDAKYAELMETGKSAADALREMVAALECDYDRLEALEAVVDQDDIDNLVESDDATELVALREAAGECTSQDEARERIQEDALEVTVRSDWHDPGTSDDEATEFCILLTTGGPAVRIMGELQDGQPCRAWLEVQDWGTSWTHYREEGLGDVLLAYAGCFYFGE